MPTSSSSSATSTSTSTAMPKPPARRPKVAVIFTGGTISMTHAGVNGSVVPTLTGADICRAVPGIERRFELTAVDFGQLPGPHMTLERMLELSERVQDVLAEGVDGVVISHGTDTLEETAYALDLMIADERPIVLVGAMRTSDDLSWDGPVNLFGACMVAGYPAARGRGVMVVMNNTINAASEVTKTYTEAIDTFVSPDTGPLGILDVGQVLFYRHPVRRQHIQAGGDPRPVAVLTATAGDDGSLVDAAVACGFEGLVISAMGRGNVPPLMADAMARAIARGVRVVVCSRCWGGRVAPVYGYPGAGARLLAMGCVLAPWHNPFKARIALTLAMSANFDDAALRELFASPAPGGGGGGGGAVHW